MRFREAHGRKVISTADAETIGRVEGYLVDPATHSVAALRLAKVRGEATVVSWSDLHTFGPDAVTVSGADRLRAPRDEAERTRASKELQVIGKQVLTDAGNLLGAVVDVEFDPTSGVITAWDLGESGVVEGGRTVGLGSYALIVAEAPST
jgi:uncharacterized protein YrrD